MIKRLFDLALAGLLLIFLSPVLALLGLAVRVTSRGPAIFKQTRTGLRGKPFTLYKFRTMRGGDDSARPRSPLVQNWDTYVFSLPGDAARTTVVGGILRRSGLDELPQLWNVLRGEMSLVGPRPELPELAQQFPDSFRRRHDVRPGITGLAQVQGRRELTYGEIFRYDLEYVDSHPLWRDVKILAQTIGAVVRRD